MHVVYVCMHMYVCICTCVCMYVETRGVCQASSDFLLFHVGAGHSNSVC